MGGLIFSGMGKGLSDAGTTIGSMMTRQIERDAELERRAREREEDRQFRRELQDDQQRSQAERDALYRRQVGASGAGGSGSGGGGSGSPIDIREGGADEGIIARRMGMTVPELRQFRRYSETGDDSAYRQDSVTGGTTTEDPMLAGENGETSDAVSRKYAKRELEIRKTLPPGFEDMARAKAKALGELEMGARMGKDNKAYQEGESERAARQRAERVESGEMSPGRAGIINAVQAGKPIFTVKGDEKLNQYTGESDTTDVGESKVRKNDRPPAPKGGAAGGATNGATRVVRTYENADGNMVAVMSDKSEVVLGKSGAFNGRVARVIADMEKNDPKFARMSEPEKRALAVGRLTGNAPEASAPAAPAATKQADPGPAPDLSKVSGVPAGSTTGSFVPGKGWEVKNNGKLIGYIGK